jgi:hypothetical protein
VEVKKSKEPCNLKRSLRRKVEGCGSGGRGKRVGRTGRAGRRRLDGIGRGRKKREVGSEPRTRLVKRKKREERWKELKRG